MGNHKMYVFLAAAIVLPGCAQKTPECADPKTIDLVTKIYFDAIRQQASAKAPGADFIDTIVSKMPIRLSLIRAQGIDEKIGKFSCDADMEITLPERAGTFVNGGTFREALTRDIDARGFEVNGNIAKVHVEYNSQLTADTRQHVVELKGFRSMVYVMVVLGTVGVLDLPKPLQSTSGLDKATGSSQGGPSLSDAASEQKDSERKEVVTQSPGTASSNSPAATEIKPQTAASQAPTNPTMAVFAMIVAAKSGNNAAILSAKVALDSFPKPDRGDRKLARERNTLGLNALKENAYETALARFNEGVAADPSDVEVKNNLGYALMMSGKLDDAKKALIESLTLDSARAAAWGNLGYTFAKQGDEDSAVAAFVNTFIFSRAQNKTVEFLTNFSQSDPDPRVKSAAAKALDAPLIKSVAVSSK